MSEWGRKNEEPSEGSNKGGKKTNKQKNVLFREYRKDSGGVFFQECDNVTDVSRLREKVVNTVYESDNS